MMTDKATVEMESPVSGTVVELAGEVGDLIPIGSTLAVIETDGEVVEAPTEETGEEEVVAETPGAEEITVGEEAEKTPPLEGGGVGEGAEAAPASGGRWAEGRGGEGGGRTCGIRVAPQ